MSQREKASDPKPYYEAHVFCCTNRRPAGHPRGCCAEKGSEALRDYKTAKRPGYDATMDEVNRAVSDADIVDLSHYLARMR